MKRIDAGNSPPWSEWKDELTSSPKRLRYELDGEYSHLERNDLEPLQVLEMLESETRKASGAAEPDSKQSIDKVNEQILAHIQWCRRALENGNPNDIFASTWELANAIYDGRMYLGHGAQLYTGQRVISGAASGGDSKSSASSEYGAKLASRNKWIVSTCLTYRQSRPPVRLTGEALRRHLSKENNRLPEDQRFDIPKEAQIRKILRASESWNSGPHSHKEC